jgi:hypothetical protein
MSHPEYISEIRTFNRKPRRFDAGGYLTIKRKRLYLRLADSAWFIGNGKFKLEKRWQIVKDNVLDFNLYPIDIKMNEGKPPRFV